MGFDEVSLEVVRESLGIMRANSHSLPRHLIARDVRLWEKYLLLMAKARARKKNNISMVGNNINNGNMLW